MNILSVKDLSVRFDAPGGAVKAVDSVSFDIGEGEVFGLIGESGSGKTLTALSILRLVMPPGRVASGVIEFKGTDLLRLDEDRLRRIRGSGISIVFQEPYSALNPVFTVGYQIAEAIDVHQRTGRRRSKELAIEFMRRSRIQDPGRIYYDYPHQLSGGTRQRVMIAMALANSPELIILDEPTTALDVTIQAQILELIEDIIRTEKISALFISHDLGVIGRMCQRIGVMRDGRIVESGDKSRILNGPEDPYTLSLLESAKALS
jgi:ABC-type dipeptide/oligopeptide/nickel transport system ATPase component